jgi:hypothetical protein
MDEISAEQRAQLYERIEVSPNSISWPYEISSLRSSAQLDGQLAEVVRFAGFHAGRRRAQAAGFGGNRTIYIGIPTDGAAESH